MINLYSLNTGILKQEKNIMDKDEFLKSPDFMRLGQSISHASWQAAGMCASRMQKNAKEADIHDFDRQLIGIKQCIANRNKSEALNILALITAKRVQLINRSREESSDTE